MEQLLHYCWKHKVFPLEPLKTTDGKSIEVLNPGMHNSDAGPDFSDAKVKIDGVLWVGSVELHTRTSDWHRHGHEGNPAYENIILHVACNVDEELYYTNCSPIPQLQLNIPDNVRRNYDELKQTDTMPRCIQIIPDLTKLQVHNWMTALQAERLEMRTQQIMERRTQLNKSWEDTLFVTIARSFGFGKNGDAFEHWAYSIPMAAVGKHRDNLMQIEAFFFGQAGLLEQDNCSDPYFLQLQKEYRYLQHKFTLTPISSHEWKFLRLRPQNFPHIRIAQLAMLYYEQRLNLSKILNISDSTGIMELLETHVSDYWKQHYTFGKLTESKTDKSLSISSKVLLIINAISPILFAYSKYKDDQQTADMAFRLLEDLKAENNHIIRNWAKAGIKCENAADSQALIHLNNNYCLRRDCLRCRFGYEYISRTPNFLKEENN